ncbi:hypothetical protein C8R46DRAFT_894274 [Mycena filopes]|nr:hypothetical protein C8R46DRAFT_894274 [Mycena filopes]
MATFNLFFTGKDSDDPRTTCVIIGEDIAPRFFCFETPDRQNSEHGVRTTVHSDNSNKVASLVFGPGNQLGNVIIGNSAHSQVRSLLSNGARTFFSLEGRRYEWRKTANVSGAYDLYAMNPPVVRIAAFRRCSEETPVGRSTGLFQYTFAQDGLLLYSLLSLCLNRWMDMYAA